MWHRLGVHWEAKWTPTNNTREPAVTTEAGCSPLATSAELVEETLAGDTSVSVVARRHDLNANQLFNWRRHYRNGLLEEATSSSAALMPVHVADPPGSPRPPLAGGEIEIHLSGGHRVVVCSDADHSVLRVASEMFVMTPGFLHTL